MPRTRYLVSAIGLGSNFANRILSRQPGASDERNAQLTSHEPTSRASLSPDPLASISGSSGLLTGFVVVLAAGATTLAFRTRRRPWLPYCCHAGVLRTSAWKGRHRASRPRSHSSRRLARARQDGTGQSACESARHRVPQVAVHARSLARRHSIAMPENPSIATPVSRGEVPAAGSGDSTTELRAVNGFHILEFGTTRDGPLSSGKILTVSQRDRGARVA